MRTNLRIARVGSLGVKTESVGEWFAPFSASRTVLEKTAKEMEEYKLLEPESTFVMQTRGEFGEWHNVEL
jgi:hypothetical protein